MSVQGVATEEFPPALPYAQHSYPSEPVESKAEHTPSSLDEADAPDKEAYPVVQGWLPRTGWITFAMISLLCQIAIIVFAGVLTRKPFILPPQPFRIPTALYNTLITATGSVFKTMNLLAWTNLGAGYLVKRLSRRNITYRYYDRAIHWAKGSIHLQASWSFVISLLLFVSFTLYAAAFTAAFGLHPVDISYPADVVSASISDNPDIVNQLITDGLFNQFTTVGTLFNDYESNLVVIAAITAYTADQSTLQYIDGRRTDVIDGLVVGAQTQLYTRDQAISDQNPSARLLTPVYDQITVDFYAAGVKASTTCTGSATLPDFQNQTVGTNYNMFTVISPTCGPQARVYDATVDVVYDAYSCVNDLSIVTGIIKTNPSTGTLEDAIECSTTLSEVYAYARFSRDIYYVYQVDKSAPMTQNGVLGIQAFTNTSWIQQIGRTGSIGLRRLIQSTPLNTPTISVQLQDAVSYGYAVGGAKIIDALSIDAQSARNSDSAPHYSDFPTFTSYTAPSFQIGLGLVGWQKVWILVFGANGLMALASAVLLWKFPIMPLDPTNPLSMTLLSLSSPRSRLFHGTSVGRLPGLPIWQKVRGILRGRREVNPGEVYEDVRFQLEAKNNHLQMTTYGNLGEYENKWEGTRAPTMGHYYA